MKNYIKSLLYILALLGIVIITCWIGATCKWIMYIEIFLTKHIWLTVIIAILLLISYIKSVIKRMKRK